MSARLALRIVLALAPCVALFAFPALADDDGGTRSPFATGAGIRALGMGGAYTALAMDAEALTWNPAGLARVTRLGFEAGHAEQSGLGARDDYASFVIPDWRWGVAAISARSIGVGGIEPRDDRNVVTGGDLSERESEITLGYSRPWSDVWSVGAAVKLQRQSLSGFDATGLGADLGALLALGPVLRHRIAWMDDVNLGLSIRNAIEPSLRLDRDSVTDPRVWRGGLAWSGALAGTSALKVALDVDRSAGVGARLHAGAELRLHPAIALRAGLDRGRLTAGTSVTWRELEVSYAFDDVNVGSTHRVGISHPFGPTTSESWTAARDAEEQKFQSRLDSEFQRRRQERIGELLASAEDAIQRGAFGTALEQISAAATLDSADARPRVLEVRCQRELGRTLESGGDFASAAVAYGRALALAPSDSAANSGATRCRAASEGLAVRDSVRQRRFRSALDALVVGDLVRARTGFSALSVADAHDVESAAMLRRTEEAITRRAAELVRQARRSLDAQSPDEARSLIAMARALDPKTPGIDDLQFPANRAAAERPAPAGAPPVGNAERRQAEELVKRGVAAMSAGRPDDALHYWELALSLNPGDSNAARYLNREYLARGMDSFAAGRLEEAVGLWEKARHANPNDPRAAGFLARARERLEHTRETFGVGP